MTRPPLRSLAMTSRILRFGPPVIAGLVIGLAIQSAHA